jgi:hypothetical protein
VTGQTAGTQPGPGEPEGGGAASSVTVRVEAGNPTPEELAAVVALLSALGGEDAAEQGSGRRSAWSDPAWRLVGPQARRGGWRVSSLPR